jgi:carbon storage regulator
MLTLTRREGETIVIAGEVHVTVQRIAGNRVSLGIEAPDGVAVDREEIWERKVRQGITSAELPRNRVQNGSAKKASKVLRSDGGVKDSKPCH